MGNAIEGFRYYVRVRGIKQDKFVEFDFAINNPDLSVELILPKPQFAEFCDRFDVCAMSDEQSDLVQAEKDVWRTGAAFRAAAD